MNNKHPRFNKTSVKNHRPRPSKIKNNATEATFILQRRFSHLRTNIISTSTINNQETEDEKIVNISHILYDLWSDFRTEHWSQRSCERLCHLAKRFRPGTHFRKIFFKRPSNHYRRFSTIQLSIGIKTPSLLPFVMPFSYAFATAPQYHASCDTSLKDELTQLAIG